MPNVLQPVNQGKPIVLDKPIVLIGRHPDCDVVILNSRKISRKHCAIALVDNHFVVRDLGSMNGLWVNGERVEQQMDLNFGDEVTIGDVAYTLQADKAAERSKPKPAASNPQDTPPAPSKASRQPESPAARKPMVKSPVQAELSMEFPVPLDDDDDDAVPIPDDDGFAIPAPRATLPEGGMDSDSGDDDFIPLKDH